VIGTRTGRALAELHQSRQCQACC